MKIWLIMGGTSREREVSLISGRAVAESLRERGHAIWAYELATGCFLPEVSTPPLPEVLVPDSLGQEGAPTWSELLLLHGRHLRARADAAFLALHGGVGEDGGVQAMLASVGMPYTGSGPQASAAAMDKAISKWVMEAIDIPTPPWQLHTFAADRERFEDRELPVMGELPLVVKPVAEGSSVGITIVDNPDRWNDAIRCALEVSERMPGRAPRILVERYVPGRELTVGILGDRPLPVVEILPKSGFYDYRHKYTAGCTEYRAPADLGMHESRRLQQYALRLYEALGCRGMARVDFRFTEGAEAHCLELNTIPGLTPLSLLPMGAAAVGMSFGEMLEEVCRLAGV